MTKNKNLPKAKKRKIIPSESDDFTRKNPVNISDNVKGSTDTTNSTGPGKTINDKKGK